MPSDDTPKLLTYEADKLPSYEEIAESILLGEARFVFINLQPEPNEIYITLSMDEDTLVAELVEFDPDAAQDDQDAAIDACMFHMVDDGRYALSGSTERFTLDGAIKYAVTGYHRRFKNEAA